MGLFNKKEIARIAELEKQLESTNNALTNTKKELAYQKEINDDLGITSLIESRNIINQERIEFDQKMSDELNTHTNRIQSLTEEINKLIEKQSVENSKLFEIENNRVEKETDLNKTISQLNNQQQKLQTIKELNKAIKSLNQYDTTDEEILKKAESLIPTVTAHLNCLDNSELRKNLERMKKTLRLF